MSRLDFSLLSVSDRLFRMFLSQLCLGALQGFSAEQHQGCSALWVCGCCFYSAMYDWNCFFLYCTLSSCVLSPNMYMRVHHSYIRMYPTMFCFIIIRCWTDCVMAAVSVQQGADGVGGACLLMQRGACICTESDNILIGKAKSSWLT